MLSTKVYSPLIPLPNLLLPPLRVDTSLCQEHRKARKIPVIKGGV